MKNAHCPNCQATTVIAGRIHASDSRESGAPFYVPSDMQLQIESGMSRQIHLLVSPFRACLACGHLWGHVNPDQLHAFVEAYANELTKQHLLANRSSDVEKSQECGELQAAIHAMTEIDALFLSGLNSEATRRYRQISGATWDQAIDTVRNWYHQTRSQKLALFGWQPKASEKDQKLAKHDHPMRDPQLDG